MYIANSYRWEKWLPKNGDLFDQTMSYLIANGIKTEGAVFNWFAETVIRLITESTYVFTILNHC